MSKMSELSRVIDQERPRLLFVVSEDWYFALHWIELARAVRDAGFLVGVATKLTGKTRIDFDREGFKLFPLKSFSRRRLNPLREVFAIAELRRIYREFAPDLVHHFVVKTCLIGTIAARLSAVPRILNSNTGGGFIYTGQSLTRRALRTVVTVLFRLIFHSSRVHILLLNEADRLEFSRLWHVPEERAWSVLGVPIDLSRFQPTPENDGTPIVLFAGRMLRDKGLLDLVEAAQQLRKSGLGLRLVLAGDTDRGNPASVDQATLEGFEQAGVIEWRRAERDMSRLYQQSHVVCLPSYREGLGAVLIEGGACGRAAVASDIAGCRDVISHGETGILVPAGDVKALADALKLLIQDDSLRRRLGAAAVRRIAEQFSLPVVLNRYLNLYRKLLTTEAAQENADERPARSFC